MRILFVHQNFPGQYRHLAPALAARGHEVAALGMHGKHARLPGVKFFLHQPVPPSAKAVSALSSTELDWQMKVSRGNSTADALRKLQTQGFVPDVVLAHPGWGEALFIKDVAPTARLVTYGEYYYAAEGRDANFDVEFSRPDPDSALKIRLKNTHLLHAIAAADCVVSPTRFQGDCHPDWAQQKLEVIHDGIDTGLFRPDANASVTLKGAGCTLRPGDEVITFIARNLEPYRGYHQFLRALPELLAQRPQARVVIVGGAGVSYGAAPPKGKTWRQIFWNEVKDRVDRERVHFVGSLPHPLLTQLLQVSAAHVYLTYPFVLSWSMLEAMSIGCLVIGSRTAPVEELITHGENGLLVDFFDPAALAGTLAEVLAHPEDYQPLRTAARRTIARHYDLRRHCLPAQIQLVERLLA